MDGHGLMQIDMDGWMDECMHACTDKWMDVSQEDGWMDERMNG